MTMRTHDNQRKKGTSSIKRFFVITAFSSLLSFISLQGQDTSSIPVAQPATTVPDSDASTPDAGNANTASAPVAASLDSMTALNDKTKLGNGDRVSYCVTEEQKEPVYLAISDSGELQIPLVGRIAAAGKTCKELAYEIKPMLEKEYFYHATVIIGLETFSTRSRGKVYLMGQVMRQGAVEIPANEVLTVSRAVLLVGGLADFADRRKVKLVRKKADGTSETTIIDLVEILDKGHADRDVVLMPEDMIIVPQRLINF